MQCAYNRIALSYPDQRHHDFILEKSDDAWTWGLICSFNAIYALRI